jgi:hypothetical protein
MLAIPFSSCRSSPKNVPFSDDRPLQPFSNSVHVSVEVHLYQDDPEANTPKKI